MSRYSTAILILLSLLYLTPTLLTGQNFPERPSGHVNDYANVLSRSQVQTLETKLRTYRDTTSNVIAIAIVEDLQGYARQEVATLIFNNWRMWEGDRQNGVLILVSIGDREMQIEVGYGLEGAVPDARANQIVNNILRPNFRNNDYYSGLNQASTALMQMAAGEYEAVSRPDEAPEIANIIVFILFLIFIFYLISKADKNNMTDRRRRRRHTIGSGGIIFGGGFGGGGFGGGGGGGSFGGFGGGGGFGSGGGGAGGSW